jgi:hypothetical protein
MKSGTKEHEIIIIGDLFYNTKHTTFQLINEIRKIFTVLNQYSVVLVIGNDYCYPIFNECFRRIDKINYEIDDNVTLFQFSKSDNNKIGYNIIKDGKVIFVENKTTPRFLEYKIKSVDELESLNITKDFIDIEIDSELLNKAEYKNKIDIYLANHVFNNVFYTEKKKEEEKVVLDSKNINIRNILTNNIEEELKDELHEIFTIYDENHDRL